jgi:hypothetical protein
MGDSRFFAIRLPPSAAPPARRERHRVDDKQGPVIIDEINNLNHPAAVATALHHDFLVRHASGPASRGMVNNVFRFTWRHTVARGML